jgi:fibro-slime domain-containing protein
VRRKFNWALYACVTWGVVACGGTPIGGATVGNPPDQSGGGSSSGGASNIGAAGDMTLPTSNGGTFNFVEGPEPDAGGSGGTDSTPVGGGSLCGNGTLDDGEQCDDGNAHPGDGCSGTCQLEPNFSCPIAGSACVTTIVCGDGHIAGEEACDDGNTTDGDGCSHDCRVEGGYDCTGGTGSTQAGQCQPVTQESCGDARITGSEACDDGNSADGDGCSHDCQIEAGYSCPNGAGAHCVREGRCGDGTVNVSAGEQCDDGNTTNGDGCTATCKVEALYVCPTPNQPCVSTVVCGDGVVNGAEQCDDHNTADGDGCDGNCQVEAGFVCAKGDVCRTICGDGIRAGKEQCDDGNVTAGDGCDPDCRLEDGYACTFSAPAGHDTCHTTTCGDGVKEGTEQCDDGNLAPYDGCDAHCHNEPVCGNDSNNAYGCSAVCGDGMKFPEEECDDGNTVDGDGCSHDCTLEAGFTCTNNAPDLGSTLNIPIIYRDFSETHPQFEINPNTPSGSDGRLPGIVASTLGADGKPVYNTGFSVATSRTSCSAARPFTMDGPDHGSQAVKSASVNDPGYAACNTATLTTSQQIAAKFLQWYHDDSSANRTFIQTLPLGQISAGTYQFAASVSNGGQFFPLDNLSGTFGNEGQKGGNPNALHNFHFTSEARQWFLHGTGSDELLSFSGDDDVWVFVNGQLTVDLGGIHSELQGSIELKGDSGQDSILCVPGLTSPATTSCSAFPVALNPNGVNEIAVFQAERHVTQSNYTLTLQGFNAPLSVCTSHCGDGVVTADEACDLGTANNTGAYGTCNADCTLPSRCGDGVVDTSDGEECDNGVNISTRLYNAGDCAPGCKLPPRCGDGNIDSSFGELCDDGASNSDTAYGKNLCNTSCRPAPFCGDHTVNSGQGEVCDDGKNDGTPGSCSADCKHAIPLPSCGDGVQDPGEQCDNGTANNGVVANGHINGCDTHCQHSCGNGIVDTGEQCDVGVNDGSYGTCNPDCTFADYCGDGHVSGPEVCDNGASNQPTSSAYGAGVCTTACAAAPRCGDHRLDSAFGEACDGTPGCTNQCTTIH